MNKRQQRARVRETRLRELGYDTYAAYLRSPAWRDVRDRYKTSDLPQVCMCGSEQWQLHHTTYERVGRELLDDLIPLCVDCHAAAHVLEAQGVIGLDLQGFYYDPARAAANTLVEVKRKDIARKQFLARDLVREGREAAERQRLETKMARRPWIRDHRPKRAPAPSREADREDMTQRTFGA